MNRIVLPAALDEFDGRVAKLLDRRSPPGVDAAAHVLSSLADRSLVWASLAVVRALRGRPNDIRAAARMVAVVGVESAVVHGAVKKLFRRERPTAETLLRFGARRPPSSSFPSGHAASAMTAAVLLAEGTRAAPLLYGLASAVAWSRVQTRLHHASDVLAGAALGVTVGVATRGLLPLAKQAR